MNVKDSGSNYSFYNGSPKATNLPRSVFDLSHINTMTAKLGIRYPVWTQHTLPNEDYKVDVEAVARVVNPPVVPLMSKQRIFFHTYWLSYHQLWKQAQLFFDKGRNKQQFKESSAISIPTIKLHSWERGSLADFLGFNCSTPFSKNDNKVMTVSALKFMAYIRIWRDCYLNQRIFSAWLLKMTTDSNPNAEWRESYKKIYDFLFPVDDADFRIGSSQWDSLVGDDNALAYLFKLKFADFADDYFTRAQLSPMYVDDDDIPSIDLQAQSNLLSVAPNNANLERMFSKYPNGYNNQNVYPQDFTLYSYGGKWSDPVLTDEDFGFLNEGSGGLVKKLGNNILVKNGVIGTTHGKDSFDGASLILGAKNMNREDNAYNLPSSGTEWDSDNTVGGLSYAKQSAAALASAINNSLLVSTSGFGLSGITIDAFRRCESATLILEKMAKTDGSYAQYAKAFFGERPKSAYDFRPTYVGGSYQSVIYSQVLNTTSDNQGKVTGIGISSGNGNIGRFHSDDYGLFITIMTITPDTYYCQGLNREDTYEVAEDFYLPERAQLGMQGVLEKEIYNQTDDKEDDNNKLFGYQNIYDELRYRANEVHGDVADVDSASGSVGASFSPYIQTRYFKSAPTLTPSFLTMEDNINNSWLSAKDEPPFIVQIANKVQAVRPVPYRAKPATFGM